MMSGIKYSKAPANFRYFVIPVMNTDHIWFILICKLRGREEHINRFGKIFPTVTTTYYLGDISSIALQPLYQMFRKLYQYFSLDL
jgi:hypothetical protein